MGGRVWSGCARSGAAASAGGVWMFFQSSAASAVVCSGSVTSPGMSRHRHQKVDGLVLGRVPVGVDTSPEGARLRSASGEAARRKLAHPTEAYMSSSSVGSRVFSPADATSSVGA